MATAPSSEHRPPRAWAIARYASLGLGLLIAFLQYYLLDIYVQILSLQRVQFLNPPSAPVRHSAHEVLRSAYAVLRLFC